MLAHPLRDIGRRSHRALPQRPAVGKRQMRLLAGRGRKHGTHGYDQIDRVHTDILRIVRLIRNMNSYGTRAMKFRFRSQTGTPLQLKVNAEDRPPPIAARNSRDRVHRSIPPRIHFCQAVGDEVESGETTDGNHDPSQG